MTGAKIDGASPADQVEDVRNMPICVRAAEVAENSYDESTNTIEVVWAAGAKVRRYSWRDGTYYDESLVMKPEAVRLNRLNAGAPFLDTHDSWSLQSVIGSVVPGSAKIERGKGVAKVKLSRAPEDAATVGKIRDGIIRNISVGYISHRVEKTEPGDDGGVAEWRVIDWEPMEISAVPIPADPDAQVRGAPDDKERKFPCTFISERSSATAADTQETAMTTKNTAADTRGNEQDVTTPAAGADTTANAGAGAATTQERSAQTGAQPDVAGAASDAAQAAIRAERERVSAIRALADKFSAREFAEKFENDGTSVENFRSALIDHLAAEQAKQPATRSNIGAASHVGEVAPEKRQAAIQNALLHRSDPANVKLTEDGRDFRGMSLLDLARDCLEARGIRVRGMSKLEIAQRALEMQTRSGLMSTSDFSTILSNVANMTLRAAYEAAPQSFRPLVRETTVADFKPVTRAQLGEAPQLDKVNEHGEFHRGSIGDAGETYRVETYGKIVGVTRQVIVNDDLEALTRLPRAFGVQAAQLESDVVWAEILGNPKMSDGIDLFHANHSNLGSAAAISVDSVGAGRLAISTQTGLDGETVLNLQPSYLIVPQAMVTKAEQFLGQIYAAKTSDAVPESLRKLQLISDARLDIGIKRFGIAGSAKYWYMSADVGQIDIVELAYLEGTRGVYTETRQGFDVDGVEIKVRLDVGAKVIDHRGLWKNPQT